MGNDYQEVSTSITADRTDVNPVLQRLNDGDPVPFAYAQVTKIHDRAGSTPAEMEVIVKNVNGPDDDPTLVTLQNTGPLCPANLPGGTRVNCVSDNMTLFLGELAQREEMGSAGAIKLLFEDDRALLRRMPVWGCLVGEAGKATAGKFSPRLPFRVNPFGLGRAILVSGVSWPVPVFTHVGYTTAAMDAGRGYPTFWTPERLWKHLWYRLYFWSGGTGEDAYAHVPRMGTKFSWAESAVSFAADEMHRKLPDLQMNGWKTGGIFDKLCEVVGTFGWNLLYSGTVSAVNIFHRSQIDMSNEPNEPPLEGVEIQLQRAGSADDVNTAYDFHVSDDYRKTVTQVTVEGAPIEIEALLSLTELASDTLEWAHTAAQFSAFKAIIEGDGTNAVVNGQVVADIKCLTREAIDLAKANYPMVGALRLKPGADLDTIMSGSGGTLAALLSNLLQINRPLASDEQIQEIDGTDLRYEVRVQVDDTNDGNSWHTVGNAGFKVRDDGLIIFQNILCDEAGTDALYLGLLADEPSIVTFKHVRINAVVFHDARCSSTVGLRSDGTFVGKQADPNGIRQELDPSWCVQATGPAEYILASDRDPDMSRPGEDGSFRLQHQVGSIPTDGQSGTLTAIYRDDQTDLDAHAARRLKDLGRIGRAHQWKVIGIRPDYRVGTFISRIRERGGDKTGTRDIQGAVMDAVFNFHGTQHTQITCEGF
jgi:hypothetical protein